MHAFSLGLSCSMVHVLDGGEDFNQHGANACQRGSGGGLANAIRGPLAETGLQASTMAGLTEGLEVLKQEGDRNADGARYSKLLVDPLHVPLDRVHRDAEAGGNSLMTLPAQE